MVTKEEIATVVASRVLRGVAEGVAKSVAEGVAKASAEIREQMALDMLADGEPIEKITKYSHLSEKEVLNLRDKMNNPGKN